MPQSIPGHKDACMKTDESPSCHGRRLRRASTILQAALAAALYTIGLTPNAFAQDAQPAQQFVPPPVETGGADVNGDGVPDYMTLTRTDNTQAPAGQPLFYVLDINHSGEWDAVWVDREEDGINNNEKLYWVK